MIKQIASRINILSALLFVSLFVAGCTNGSSPGAPPTTLTVPGIGSMFVVNHYEIDSSSKMIGSTQYYDTVIVIATGLTYMGKSNVMQLRTPTSGHTLYNSFEPDADISKIYPLSGNPGSQSGWVTFPIASKGKTEFNTVDTTIFGQHEVQTLTLTYAGNTTRTLAGHNFYVVGILYNLSGYLTPDGTTYGQDTMWFAPEIGQYVGTDRSPYLRGNGKWTNGYHAELSFYQLK